jgi:hypothetical protein
MIVTIQILVPLLAVIAAVAFVAVRLEIPPSHDLRPARRHAGGRLLGSNDDAAKPP